MLRVLEQPGGARRSGGASAARRAADAASRARTLLIVVTADRGLCGSFNTNVIKAAAQFIAESAGARRWRSAWSAARAATSSRRRGFDVRFEQVDICSRSCTFDDAQAIADAGDRGRSSTGEVDSVYLVYNEFKSVMAAARRRRAAAADSARVEIDGRRERRPAPPMSTTCTSRRRRRCSTQLLPRYVEVQVFRALLESNAAFYAAQMTAMDAATRNSADMIESLTLYMNKVRQAAITREIIEVVSGAQAL